MKKTCLMAFVVGLVAAGCSSKSVQSGADAGGGGDDDAGAGKDSTTSIDLGGEASQSTGDAGVASLPFAPSNVPAASLVGGAPGAMTFDGSHCGGKSLVQIDTDTGETNCSMVVLGQDYRYAVAMQADGSNVAVFVTRSLRIETTVTVEVKGQLPLVIVAYGAAQILGQLSAAATSLTGVAGGFSALVNMAGPGNGPGGGKHGMNGGGGGGSFCGIGGKGGSGNLGGSTYGLAKLTPLLGGSSGANGGIYEAGAGGGAIQIIAGQSITIGATGIIHVGGAGGSQSGSGGGSGGAILLEAPTVTVAGALAANGGGGGSGTGSIHGADATPDDQVALGGASVAKEAPGGDGAAGPVLNGTDGTLNPAYPGGDFSGGGGGGAGYIRINTTSGAASITGKLSPASTTACVSQGALG